MKVLHFANWGIRKSGLYECTKDQIKYERKNGLDSQLALYEVEYPPKSLLDDGWLKPVSWDWAKNADLFVIHRGLPLKVKNKYPNKKTLMIIHGTAEFLILEEIISKANNSSFNTHINLINSYDNSVSVNKQDYAIYKIYDRDNKLSFIHDAVDISKFTIKGYKYPYKYHPQILYCDSLRVNKNPSSIIWAMSEIHKKIPDARLTILGLDLESILTWRNLILRSAKRRLKGLLENIQLLTNDVRPYMRGADILFNGNMSGIPSRVEMEAMACGCQIISYNGGFTRFHPKPFDIKSIAKEVVKCWDYIKNNKDQVRQEARNFALKYFNMEKQVKKSYLPLYKKILGEK